MGKRQDMIRKLTTAGLFISCAALSASAQAATNRFGCGSLNALEAAFTQASQWEGHSRCERIKQMATARALMVDIVMKDSAKCTLSGAPLDHMNSQLQRLRTAWSACPR
jgi:hypothetical protein